MKTRDSITTTPSLCLAMVVCNEALELYKCLGSVRNVVSSFVVFDLGSTDNTKALMSNMLSHKEGEIVDVETGRLDDYLERLYDSASKSSDYVLFVGADEVFSSTNYPTDHLIHDIVLTEVDHGRCSFMEPRIIKSGLSKPIPIPFRSGQVLSSDWNVGTVEHIRLKKQQIRGKGAGTFSRDIRYDQLAARSMELRTPGDCVELAIMCSRRGDLPGALNSLEEGLNRHPSSETNWLLRYLRGLAHLDSGEKAAAFDDFILAFELDPDRLEPLHQLIKLKTADNDLRSALELSRISLESDIPLNKGYFERKIYEWDRYVHFVSLLERLREPEQLAQSCEVLLDTPDLGIGLRKFLKQSKKSHSVSSRDLSAKPAASVVNTRRPLLTVGMATIDDYDGVYFSLMSFFMLHGESRELFEFIVIDNSPNGPAGKSINELCERLGILYKPIFDYRSTAVRDSIFRYATGSFVLCMDSHVMLLPESIGRLLDYIEANPDSNDLLQGPLANDNRDRFYTHLEPRWQDGMYGVWAETEGFSRFTAPFEIGMQGLGVFCCKREAWPGLNPRFVGFGGEEGYLHEKFRRSGGKVICLSFLVWVHRFERPLGTPYQLDWRERIRNYLIGFDELGLDISSLSAHFTKAVGYSMVSNAFSMFMRERDSPFYRFDAIYWIDDDSAPEISNEIDQRFVDLGIASRIRKIPTNSRAGAENSMHVLLELLDTAMVHGYKQLLVFNNKALISNDIDQVLRNVLYELDCKNWSFCFLGHDDAGSPVVSAEGHESEVRKIDTEKAFEGSVDCLWARSTSFLANIGPGTEAIASSIASRLGQAKALDRASLTDVEESATSPELYLVDPPTTIRRDRFPAEKRPARFCFIGTVEVD